MVKAESEYVLQDPGSADHGRGAIRDRGDGQDRTLSEQAASRAVLRQGYFAEIVTRDAFNAVVPGEPLR